MEYPIICSASYIICSASNIVYIHIVAMASSSIPKVLREFGSTKFDIVAMEKCAGAEVAERFKQALADDRVNS